MKEIGRNHVLCVAVLVEVVAGVVGREGAGLTGAGVVVIVAGVDEVDADAVVTGAAGVTGTFCAVLCGTATVDTVSTTLIRMHAFGP